ncbi:MAG TPA: SDR family NAD(P)-dependent oxidoreductase [Chloroflexi bacterium]|nr:SDR family NAD(P)-dependent oxidoreductase [Chloroflexota bacterium]
MNFDQQHVIITGGSSGIGRATARLLIQRGAHVSIIARRQELLDETAAELQALRGQPEQRIRAHAADLSAWEQAREAIAALTADGFPPDVLINSAGITHPGYFEHLDLDVFRRLMDVNFFGTLHSCRAVVPLMMERGRGQIVNLSSVAGFLGVFGYTAYCATKFAVRGFSDVLRQELKPHGIHVSVVFPPDTDTPQLQYEDPFKPLETRRISGTAKTLTADQVAQAIVRGIERRQVYILPNLDTRLYFMLVNGFTGLARWILDWTIAQARRERELDAKGS